MRDLNIAYGNSCMAKKWSNKTITFGELCGRLENTIRTTETVEEYQKMKRAEREAAKDKGGFVGGQLKGGRRKRENVVSRSMLTMDVDKGEKGFIESYEMLASYTSVLYTTHGHTPEAPRFRIIIPLTRDVTPDEYQAIARYFAAEWGIDQFDECSYRPHQLMYWPTTPSNGEYICEKVEGEWLDPDVFLSFHPNWQDCSLLPTSSRESEVKESSGKKMEDPEAKGGVVGLFCRAYPIREAIDTFLSNVYEPSANIPGRYSYIPADSSAGVQIFEEKFAHSFHASDPACGRSLNSFDLVRVHKFGDEDEKKSFQEMCDFAMSLDKVRVLAAEEKKAEADMDFDDGEDWREKLRYMPRSKVLENSVFNEVLILNNDPDFQNFAFNEMANRIQITGEVPWNRPDDNKFWRDADTAQLKAILDTRYTSFSTRNHDVSFLKVADDRSFHPVRDYLDGLPSWDGKERVDTLLIDYFDADDTPYVRAVTRKMLVAAVTRIYHPGTKFDSVPVLDGKQGIGKSTFLKDLCGEEYYADNLSLTDMNDKAAAEKLQGFWIVEIPELAGMKKADIEKVKAFITTTDDKYRPSYGRTVESHPRQCVVIASVNGERGYLRDITGNRRFWVVKLKQTEQKRKWHFTQEEKDQIWAEAKKYYEEGEKLYLEGELLESAEMEQKKAMELDERQGIVEDYLNMLLPERWDKMDLYARRSYINEKDGPTVEKGTVKREYVSNVEIWSECFGRSPSDMKPADSYSIAALMTQIPGWERSKDCRKKGIYGKQRVYVRTEEQEKLEKSREQGTSDRKAVKENG